MTQSNPQPFNPCPHKILMTLCGDCNYTHSDCQYQILKWDGEMLQKMLCGVPHTPAAPAERHLIYTVGECMTQCQKAREDEREQVIEILGDLNKYSCEEYEEASLSDNEREMRIHLEYGNRTWGIIRSLRGGGAP